MDTLILTSCHTLCNCSVAIASTIDIPQKKASGREFCTATVRQGLCYYLDCLRSLSGMFENTRIVHIVTSHIQMNDRQFDNTYDPGQMEKDVSL